MTLRHCKDMYLIRKDRLAKSRRKALRRASRQNVMLYSSDHEQEPVSPQAYKTMVKPLPDSNMAEQTVDDAEALSDFQDCDDPISRQLSKADMELFLKAYRISQDELLGRRSLPLPNAATQSDDIKLSDTSDTESTTSGSEGDKPEPIHLSMLELFSYYLL